MWAIARRYSIRIFFRLMTIPGTVDVVIGSAGYLCIWRHSMKRAFVIISVIAAGAIALHASPRPSLRRSHGQFVLVALAAAVQRRKTAAERAAIFSNLGRRLSAVRTAREAAQIVADAAEAICRWDSCVLDVCSQNGEAVTTIYCVDTIDGQRTEVPAETLATALSPIAKKVITEGPQLVLRDTDAGFLSGAFAFGDKTRPSASLIFVPVRDGTTAIGILSIQSYLPKAYDREDLDNLQALADHCSGALERVWAEAELRETNERLGMALAAGKMGTWTTDLAGRRQVTVSPELEAILGLRPGEFAGTEDGFFEFIHPQDRKALRQAFARAMEIKGDYEVEFRFMPRDRATGWMLGRGRAYCDADGKPMRLAGVAIDITGRKEAERQINEMNSLLEMRVAERTMELQAINHELEAFAYSVSHDLRAPLRSIKGFTEALLDRPTGELDDLGQEYLRRVCASSIHMERLIDDLLKLSRATLGDLSRQRVNLTRMAESIVAELGRAEPARQVRVSVAPDLAVDGDERLLNVALDNLLRNAWKFTGSRPEAKIEFGYTTIPEPAFFVRDDGVGFDMKYAEKLFGVFQRLHPAKDFPGTGVGLATVQRIVKRHGGRIWATGVVNGGATFYFTLPTDRTVNREAPAPGVDC